MSVPQEVLDDLARFDVRLVQMFGAMPMFWGGDPQAMRLIESHGIDFYYLVALSEHTVEENKVMKTYRTPTLLRIEHSFMGRSISLASHQEVGLFTSTKTGEYQYFLPQMPYEFTQKIDAFFRKAHQVHGTEAILVLTFDPSALSSSDPGSGWGCIAPAQKNTSTHCSYEMNAVMQVKPPHVNIVGTWHSHPNMSAFFSGTDHQDQDDWDGIHITTGWSAGGPSEFYISVISNHINYEYKPDVIFAPAPTPTVNVEEVDSWIQNVELAVHTSAYSDYGYTGTYSKTYAKATSATGLPARHVPTIKLPPGAPDPRLNTIIAKLSFAGKKKCPFCDSPIAKKATERLRCLACESFIITDMDSLATLVAKREAAGQPYLIELDYERAAKPIIICDVDAGRFTEDLRVVPDPK